MYTIGHRFTAKDSRSVKLGVATQFTGRTKRQYFVVRREEFFLLYIANYNLLNTDRVISKVEVREGREAGIIHRWFTGVFRP